ncbi:MAG: methyl-accepting chemotaxis protein [Deltaproteobacteria bacterium]|nr:methyl-accepting chemotaxis protein [Deltaproteobacteria bacterium]
MNNKPSFRRRHYFIDKKFQTGFAVKFLVIVAVAVIAGLVLFLYYSTGTITAGYTGSEVKLLKTGAFFLPTLLASTFAIIFVSGSVAIIVMILISHRIAGPLYRFEKILTELYNGDLTLRFSLRKNDQLKDLADRINGLSAIMDEKIGNIKTQAIELDRLASELQMLAASHPAIEKDIERLIKEIKQRLVELQDAAQHFKTTQPK